MNAYRIERLNRNLISGVAELRRVLFGKSLEANIAYFKWMYRENPYIDDPPMFIALHDGVPVGIRGTLGTRWKSSLFRSEHTLPSFTDTGIHPSHRDRGLYEELTDRMLEEHEARGFSHALNMTPSPENFIASTLSKGGWATIGRHGTLAHGNSDQQSRVKHLARTLSRRLPRNAIIDASREWWARFAVQRSVSAMRQRRHHLDVSTSVESLPRPGAMADLVAHINADARIHHLRDSEYFSWRYRNPLARYRFIYAERDAELTGYGILQSPVDGVRVDILDLEAGDDASLAALLDAITSGRLGVPHIWSSTLPPSFVSALVDHGFEEPEAESRYADRIILRCLGSGGRDLWSIEGVDLRSPENWDFRAAIATTY